jgi:hypothetical protein
MGLFDVIEKLYKNISNTYFKANENIPKIKKQLALKTIFDDKKIDTIGDEDLNKLYSEFANFTTYMAPFEGIYINENIIGLIKVLAQNVANKSDSYILNHLTSIQDVNLNFETQKKNLRYLNFNLYKEFADSTSKEYENIYRSEDKLEELQKSSYSSQKIYEYDNPFIKSIINVYTKQRNVEFEGKNVVLKDISSFKLFYLFSNTQMTKKCKHQWKLLNETVSFINTINESK